jgi:hypothetical protein
MKVCSRRQFLETASQGLLGAGMGRVMGPNQLLAVAERTASHPLSVWEEEPQRRIFPDSIGTFKNQPEVQIEGCLGERVCTQLGLRSEKGLAEIKVRCSPFYPWQGSKPVETDFLKVRAVGLVPCVELGMMTPDALEERESFELEPKRSASLWLDVIVPVEAKPGQYQATLDLHLGKEVLVSLPLRLDVLPIAFPPPGRFDFHLSIWQDAAAIARYYRTDLWSTRHWELIQAYARNLAAHGQKTITTIIVEDPWASQTGYPHPTMVLWRYPGEWDPRDSKRFKFDYTVFDQYVETFLRQGIEIINCFSPVHWGPFAYFDEKSKKTRYRKCELGDDWYIAAWNQFLPDLIEHLKKKNWLRQTYLAMDEAPSDAMEKVWPILRSYSSDLKIHLAGGGGRYGREAEDLCYYYFSLYEAAPEFPKPDVEERRRDGKRTTFYVCTGPTHPNTFLYSPAYGARQLPWLVWKLGYDGFLRWAFNSWPDRLWEQPNYRWGSGDMFLVYPGKHGPMESLRWQLLFAGIQDYQCLKMLERKLADRARSGTSAELVQSARLRLAEAVKLATTDEDPFISSRQSHIQQARRQVNQLLRELS